MKKLYNGLMTVGICFIILGNTFLMDKMSDMEAVQQELQSIIINQDRAIEKLNGDVEGIQVDILDIGKKDINTDEELSKLQKEIKNIK